MNLDALYGDFGGIGGGGAAPASVSAMLRGGVTGRAPFALPVESLLIVRRLALRWGMLGRELVVGLWLSPSLLLLRELLSKLESDFALVGVVDADGVAESE